MDLYAWTVIFLKHQDLFKKEIKELVEEKDRILLKKRKDEVWLVHETLNPTAEARGIVCLNTKQNLKALIAAWNDIKDSTTKFVFANPRTNERWIVVPAHHHRIADKVKAGLEALFASITEYR